MSNALDDYFKALRRLEKGKPVNVPKETEISNDAVSLEAGRGKGSIKRSRLEFAQLIEEIKAARTAQKAHQNAAEMKFKTMKEERDKYKQLYEEGLARELSLLHENTNLKRSLAKNSAINVTQLKRK